jgi:hypothetical protein
MPVYFIVQLKKYIGFVLHNHDAFIATYTQRVSESILILSAPFFPWGQWDGSAGKGTSFVIWISFPSPTWWKERIYTRKLSPTWWKERIYTLKLSSDLHVCTMIWAYTHTDNTLNKYNLNSRNGINGSENSQIPLPYLGFTAVNRHHNQGHSFFFFFF